MTSFSILGAVLVQIGRIVFRVVTFRVTEK